MIFIGTDANRSFEFAPERKSGILIIENYTGSLSSVSERPIRAGSISISGLDYKLGKRLEERDEEALAIVESEIIVPVEGTEGTFQLNGDVEGLSICANVHSPRRSIMGGFDTFTEVPAPGEPGISFAPKQPQK